MASTRLRENRPYLIDLAVARETVGADATWDQEWEVEGAVWPSGGDE